MRAAGDIVVSAGLVFILLGLVGLIRFKDFYARILVTAMIETAGAITIILGVAIKHGFGFFSLKIFLLLAVIIISGPLATHMITRAAYISGYKSDIKHEPEKKTGDGG